MAQKLKELQGTTDRLLKLQGAAGSMLELQEAAGKARLLQRKADIRAAAAEHKSAGAKRMVGSDDCWFGLVVTSVSKLQPSRDVTTY